jgi:hypothetical protein
MKRIMGRRDIRYMCTLLQSMCGLHGEWSGKDYDY